MVARVGSIEVLLRASYDKYERDWVRASKTTERYGGRMQQTVGRTDRSVRSLNRSMQGLRGREFRVLSLAALRTKDSVERLRGSMVAVSSLIGGFGAAFTLKGLVEYSDTYKEVANRLRVVKKEATDLSELELKIFKTAQRSRSQYAATGTLYARLANSARRLSLAQSDILRVTETIQKSFLIGGATPVEAAQSTIQLSQGIASNRLQGDELRSVLENPALSRLLSEQITDGDIGKLREMAAEGELTAGVIVRAFRNASEEIDALFAKTDQTIGQAFIKLDNAILRYIGTSDTMNQATGATVVLLNAMAQNIETVADSLILLGGVFAASIGGRAISGAASSLVSYVSLLNSSRNEAISTAKSYVDLTKAEVKSTRSGMLKHRLAVNRAYKQGVLTVKQVTALEKNAARAVMEHRAALQSAAAAQRQFNIAKSQSGVIAKTATVALRGMSGVISLLGGPLGAAMTAFGLLLFANAKHAQAAEERTARYAEAIKKAGQESAKASKGIREVARSLAAVSSEAGEAETRVALDQAAEDAGALRDQIAQNVILLKHLAEEAGLAGKPIMDVARSFLEGAIGGEAFKAELDKISRVSPVVASLAAKTKGLASEMEAAKGTVDGLNDSLQTMMSFDDQHINIGINIDRPDVVGRIEGAFSDDVMTEFERRARNMAELKKKLQKQLNDLGGAPKKEKKSKKPKKTDAERAAERLAKGMERLRGSAAIELLSDLDQKVVSTARSFGIAEERVKAFIMAASSGNFENIDDTIAEIRVELEKIAKSKEIKQVSDSLAGAFGSFVKAGLTGSSSLEEAFANLKERLLDVVVELLIIKPLVESLSNAFSTTFSGGGGGGGNIFDLIFGITSHSGTVRGTPTPTLIPAAALNGAPKFHRGMGGNEIAAILDRSEAVLTSRDQKNVVDNMNGLISRVQAGEPSGSDVRIFFDDNGNLDKAIERRSRAAARSEVSRYDEGASRRSVRANEEFKKRGYVR